VEPSDRYVLLVGQDDGKVAASIGESAHGGGVITVGDRGVTKAAMLASDDAGTQVAVVSHGSPLAFLAESNSGGGLFKIFNAQGVPMVEATAGKGGFGVVAAGPGGFTPGAGLLGLPASYIAGKPQD
jgi:hypothetical protein